MENKMQERIEKFIEQRTLMLAGVSHDLRTPLTRIKLQLEMLSKNKENEELLKDVDEMQYMLGQIDGVRFEGSDLFLPVQCFGDRVIISGTLMTRQD